MTAIQGMAPFESEEGLVPGEGHMGGFDSMTKVYFLS